MTRLPQPRSLLDRAPVGARVHQLDTERVRFEGQHDPEVAPPYAPMRGGVRGQLGDDLSGPFERQPPDTELLDGEQPCEAGAPAGGGQLNPEPSCRSAIC